MQSYGEIRDLLVSYDSTYTKSREQAFPLEAASEPISGGDAYYEDFTEGLRRFVASRTGSAQAKTGGSAGGVFVLTLSGGSAADLLDDPSDDELDAPDNDDRDNRDDRGDQCGCAGRADQSILAYQRSAADTDGGTTGGSAADGPAVTSSTSAGKSISTTTDTFGDDIKSLLAYVQDVGDMSGTADGGDDAGDSADGDNDADDATDDATDDVTDAATGGGDDDGSFVMVDAGGEDNGAAGEMDESETERIAQNAHGDHDQRETILGAVVDTDRNSAPPAGNSD